MAKNKPIKWTKQNNEIALALAEGCTIVEASERVGCSTSTIERRRADIDFMAEVDRLTLMVGIASRAQRIRIANKVVNEKFKEELGKIKIETTKDLLDWLKFAQSETDGIKLNLVGELAALLANGAPVAGSGPAGTNNEDGDDTQETD